MRWRVLILALSVAACAPQAPPAPLREGADVDAIVALEQQLSVVTSARDVDGSMGLYHADASMIAPNGQRLTRADIQRYYVAMADDPNARFETERARLVEVAGGDGLAYSTGGYSEQRAATERGRVQVTVGQTLRVWKRENGAWRIVIESRTPERTRID